jgi:hypothetical protein
MTMPINPKPLGVSIGRSTFIGTVPEHRVDVYWDPVDCSLALVDGGAFMLWYVYEDDRIRVWATAKTHRMQPTDLPFDLEVELLRILQDNDLCLECTAEEFER